MLVLKIVGWTLLSLLALLLLLGLFVLLTRFRIELRGKNGELTVRVGIGPFRLRIYPPPARAAEKTAAKPPKPGKPKKAKKERPPREFYPEQLSKGEMLDLVLDLLAALRDRLRIETLLLNLVFATPDAAKTGLLLGGASAAAGILTPFLEENFNMEELHITLDADFDGTRTRWAAVAVFAMRPVSVLCALWHERKRLYHMYQQFTKKDEANN